MNGRTLRIALVGLAVLAQLAVPISMIVKHERTLTDGELFRFRTAPVDPVDAFRGRYVALALEDATAPALPGVSLLSRQRVYALLGTGDDGFARVTELALERPERGAFIEARVYYQDPDTGRVHLHMPLDRYYMPEDLAPRAESVYRQRGGADDSFIAVRVRDGFSVIEDLYVAGQPIRELLAADPPSD